MPNAQRVLCTSRRAGKAFSVRPGSLLHVYGLALYVQEAFYTSKGFLCTSRGLLWTSMGFLCTFRQYSARLWTFSVRPGYRLYVQRSFLHVQEAVCTSWSFGLIDIQGWFGHPGPTQILEAKPHPEPLAKHIENVSLARFSFHLKGGVRDSWFWGPIYE